MPDTVDDDWMDVEAGKQIEQSFQQGIRSTPWYKQFIEKKGGPPNLDDPDYDYRAAWSAGARPDVVDKKDGLFHWPSKFKGDNHPNRFVNGVDTKKSK